MNEIITKSSKGHKIGSSGAALAILCFFMPWILVSCGGQSAKLSGWELAAGTTVGGGFSAQQIPGKPILFLVLLAALGVIAFAYFAYKRGALTKIMDGWGLIGLGALAILILFASFSGAKEQGAQQGMYIDFEFGLWGAVIGYLAAIVGGILNLRE